MTLFPSDGQTDGNDADCQRANSLAQEQKDAALMMGAYRILAVTLYFWVTLRPRAKMRGVAFNSGAREAVQSPFEEVNSPVVVCLTFRPSAGGIWRNRLLPNDHGGSDLAGES